VIDKEIFVQRIALLAGRIGRDLEGPVQAEYYVQLSAALTTEQFHAATAIAFHSWNAEYRNWPSPAQLIEYVVPVTKPSLSAAEAFDKVLKIASRHPASAGFATREQDIQLLGATTARAFRAAGGFREFTNALESDVPWLRKRFVELFEASCESAERDRAANLAIASANARVAALMGSVADKLTMPQPPRRVTAGGGR
jgi:hypothetical protein